MSVKLFDMCEEIFIHSFSSFGIYLKNNMTKEKVHWRKKAKVCPDCNKLTTEGSFYEKEGKCFSCAFGDCLSIYFKNCGYCRRWIEKDKFKTNICQDCLKLSLDRHHQNKHLPKLKKGKKYVCKQCKIEKSALSYHRGTELSNLICKVCVTENRIEKEGKFRCKMCGSVFLKEEILWSKYCKRCFEKNKEWNRLKQREYRKDPIYQEYARMYSRYRWHCVEKPLRNKKLCVQLVNGEIKKRNNNRNSTFYVLNHQLFLDFKQNFKKHQDLANKIYREHYAMPVINRRLGGGYSRKEIRELNLNISEDDWE